MTPETILSPAPVDSHPNLVPRIRYMAANHTPLVDYAHDFFTEHFHGPQPINAIPGCDTWTRLANRLSCGASIQSAAFKELDYRLSLAMQSRAFPAPCLLGQ